MQIQKWTTTDLSGQHARQCLDIKNREALYQIVPNSLVKSQLMELHEKFDQVRELYIKRFLTQEERNSAIYLCETLRDCFQEYFPYIKVTREGFILQKRIFSIIKKLSKALVIPIVCLFLMNPSSSTMHLITDHIAEYLNIPDGTGNLLDMSSSGLESSNKTERFLIHLRSVSWVL